MIFTSEYEIFLNFIGMIYELIVIIISLFLVVLVIMRYREKKNKLTLYLLTIFFLYLLAIIFSWLSKVFVVLRLDEVVGAYTIVGVFFYRINSFRISEFFVCIAIFYSYILKVNVFQEEYNKTQRVLLAIFGAITCFYVLVIYIPGDDSLSTLLDAIAFLLVFILMASVYIPFMYRAIETYRGIQEKEYKTAFLSLAVMAFSFSLIFLNFLLDRIIMLITGSPGFTPFYFAAWAFGIVGILGSYAGYIRPSREK